MGKLTLTLAAAALIVGSVALSANAQQQGASSVLNAQAQNATIIHKTACSGFRPLVPAGNAPGLRPRPLLVRSPVSKSYPISISMT